MTDRELDVIIHKWMGRTGSPLAYSNESSPRSLMAEVEKAVVEKFGTDRLYEWTVNEVNGHSEIYAIWATALQRATACVAVIEAGEAETE